jgi:glucose-1-phosphate adenylyltransferase
VIGIRSRVGRGTRIEDALVLGADEYESLEEIDRAQAKGLPPVGIGEDCHIRRAIIDKNARVGRGVRILNEAGEQEKDGESWFIRDGIVIVPKGGVIPDGTVL